MWIRNIRTEIIFNDFIKATILHLRFSLIMYCCWLFLFIYKLYFHNDIFKHIKRKHGKDIATAFIFFENLKTKYENILWDINFIKTCKQGNILPTFVKVRLLIKNASYKLKQRMGRDYFYFTTRFLYLLLFKESTREIRKSVHFKNAIINELFL